MSDLENLTVAELRELAEKEEVDLTGKTLKADIIAALEEVGIESTEDVLPAGDSETDATGTDEGDAASGDDDSDDADEDEDDVYVPKAKPELDDERRAALGMRAAKQRKNPRFRRQEWFRYRDLGGKNAPWRRPRGMHSKQRLHLKYRPPVVSVGYRTPAEARGLHPSGFEEVLVHRPDDLEGLDPKLQAARIGRTVGGRKAAAIQEKADGMGVRILNRRDF